MKRRRFFATLGGLAPTIGAACASGSQVNPRLDRRTLRALGEAVLPSELGPDGVRRVTGDFEGWVAAYREGTELLHGYGSAEIEHAPEHPGQRWAQQLIGLDLAAVERFGTPFAEVDVGGRRALVEPVLADDTPSSLPTPSNATHVAVALLSHFYRSPEAANLCYGARIDPRECRPLSTVDDRPAAS